MKKILATTLCLVIGAPCFAYGPMNQHYKPQLPPHNNRPIPQQTMHVVHPQHRPPHHHHMSRGAKTAVAIAGIAGVAMLVAAIAD